MLRCQSGLPLYSSGIVGLDANAQQLESEVKRPEDVTVSPVAGVEIAAPLGFMCAGRRCRRISFRDLQPLSWFSIRSGRSPFHLGSTHSGTRPSVGLFCQLCVVTIRRRSAKLLSASFRGLAQSEFYSGGFVSMGMAFLEHLQACYRRGIAGIAGVEAAARLERRVGRRNCFCASSRTS